jgi:hypothetical protein
MDPAFVYQLDGIRRSSGVVMVINSGFRCYMHNLSIISPTSSHLLGLAVDIKTFSSRGRYLLIKAAQEAGIPRIGIAKDFIHLDVDHNKPGSLIWTY